jgi:pimeloyl-ACP methyl ester carboxylesterase
VHNRCIVLLLSFSCLGLSSAKSPASDQARVKSGYIQSGTARLYYEERGRGVALIMIHGGGLDRRNWDDQFNVLAERYQVIRYDARNHGLSQGEPETFSHHEDLYRLMNSLGIPEAVIIGLSMGGYIAIDFALAHPEKVMALIPVSPGLTGYEFKDRQVIENNKRISEAKDLDEAVEYIMRSWTAGPYRSPEQIDPGVRNRAREMYTATYQNWRRGNREERLKPEAIGRLAEIRVPTLVVVGDLDMPGILEIASLIEKNVASAKKSVIRGAAHLVNMEKPKEFNQVVLDFLSDISPYPARPETSIVPDLSEIVQGQGWKVVNRGASELGREDRHGIRFDERPGQGLAWLENVQFAEGDIEFEVRGKDVFQRSFVGIAFHGVDEKTYEAVYFRPFNFKNPDPARAAHAVQYVSHPEFTWQKLRAERPGQFEKPVRPVPDPNAWFHVRLAVDQGKILVYVNGAAEPSLEVEKLGVLRQGKIGLFIGNGSGGDFASLKIIPARHTK